MAPLNRTSFMVLVLLLLQTSLYTVLRKYSTMTEKVASKEILIVAEFIKIVFSIYQVLEGSEPSSSQGEGVHKLVWLLRHSSKMILLAALYMFMNILSFVSLEYIGAGEFTVCAQLKILTTVTFSRLILGTTVSDAKWRALIQLIVGCILVSSPAIDMAQAGGNSSNSGASDASATVSAADAAAPEVHDAYTVILFGYGAVLLEVTLSGFATVYFEGVVKSKTEVITVWERNFQLAFYSMLFYMAFMFYEATVWGGEAAKHRLFENWSWLTVLVALLSGTGGLLVAATLKYSDAIMKTLATAGAIVLASIAGYFFLDAPMTYIVVLGCITTILSIVSYSFDTSPPPTAATALSAASLAASMTQFAGRMMPLVSSAGTSSAVSSGGARDGESAKTGSCAEDGSNSGNNNGASNGSSDAASDREPLLQEGGQEGV